MHSTSPDPLPHGRFLADTYKGILAKVPAQTVFLHEMILRSEMAHCDRVSPRSQVEGGMSEDNIVEEMQSAITELEKQNATVFR